MILEEYELLEKDFLTSSTEIENLLIYIKQRVFLKRLKSSRYCKISVNAVDG